MDDKKIKWEYKIRYYVFTDTYIDNEIGYEDDFYYLNGEDGQGKGPMISYVEGETEEEALKKLQDFVSIKFKHEWAVVFAMSPEILKKKKASKKRIFGNPYSKYKITIIK